MKVSVITLNWNGYGDTEHCVQSLIEHSSPETEILIWDNGSKENDADRLEKKFGSRIRVHRSPENIGAVRGYNAAAKEVMGDVLIFINNDTEVTKGWLEPLVAALDDTAIAACQPKIKNFFRRDFFDYCGACGGFIDRFGYPYMRGRLFSMTERDAGQYDTSIDIHWASAACIAIRKDVWNEMGGVDEDFFIYMDEVDLCWRIYDAGYRIVVVPPSTIYHKGAATMGKYRCRKRFYEHRNNLLMLLKNLPTLDLLWRLPIRLLLEWVSIVFYIITLEWRAALGAIGAFFSFLFFIPRFVRKRGKRVRHVRLSPVSIVSQFFLFQKRKYSDL